MNGIWSLRWLGAIWTLQISHHCYPNLTHFWHYYYPNQDDISFALLESSFITNLMGHDLAIIVVWNLLFIGSYGINTNVIHLLVLFKHWYHAHCLDTNVICLFILFKHGCCMFICVVYTRKSYTQLSCLNNARHSCLTNTNLWNNKFRMDLKWTHEVCKFVMLFFININLKHIMT